MSISDEFKDYINFECEPVPKKIIFHDIVGAGDYSRDIFICEEQTSLKDYIITGYVVIDEKDDCYDSISEHNESKHEDVLKLLELGCDYTGTSVYYVVPGSENYCVKDKKVAGIAIIKSYITEWIMEDKPKGCDIHNWIDFINKDAIYTEIKGILIDSANYLIEQSKK